ncbi:MAG: DUF362 domain-containing protein [Thermoanaerobaculia bacterium]
MHAPRHPPPAADAPARPAGNWRRTAVAWVLANSLLSGLFALAWLLLRSGRRPSRLAYPCQRAALATATIALGAPAIAALVALRRRLARLVGYPAGLATLGVVLFAAGVTWSVLVPMDAAPTPAAALRAAPQSYRAEVFHAAGCAAAPAGDRFPCLDDLLALMGHHGLKLYRSAVVSDLSGPDGIVAANDVVVVKINYQWPERGGSNTDLLRGLVQALTAHPDGFTGEVVIAENAQFAAVANFDRLSNNAEDPHLSPHDVVLRFQELGYTVSQFDWTAVRTTEVAEYSTGNMSDGYVVYPYDAMLHGRISYPKFRAASGTYVSLRDGIWNPGSATYDRGRLKLINLPVLKSHHAVYGATACVKNFMGLVTDSLSSGSHNAIRYGILGAVLGEIRPPDLNLLDAIWVNGNPNSGPSTSYSAATRRDELVASRDPVAADRWAVANVLIPAFVANGFQPPWPTPSADPDNPTSAFRGYLDASMDRLLAAGFTVTNDPAQIDVYEFVMLFRGGFESGDTVGWSSTAP